MRFKSNLTLATCVVVILWSIEACLAQEYSSAYSPPGAVSAPTYAPASSGYPPSAPNPFYFPSPAYGQPGFSYPTPFYYPIPVPSGGYPSYCSSTPTTQPGDCNSNTVPAGGCSCTAQFSPQGCTPKACVTSQDTHPCVCTTTAAPPTCIAQPLPATCPTTEAQPGDCTDAESALPCTCRAGASPQGCTIGDCRSSEDNGYVCYCVDGGGDQCVAKPGCLNPGVGGGVDDGDTTGTTGTTGTLKKFGFFPEILALEGLNPNANELLGLEALDQRLLGDQKDFKNTLNIDLLNLGLLGGKGKKGKGLLNLLGKGGRK